MKITIPYTYTASIIPPRCRKARDVRQQATMTLTIHDVTAHEAPVAIIAHDADWKIDLGEPTTTVYRWWRNRLWTRYFSHVNTTWETQGEAAFRAEYEEPLYRHLWDASGYLSQQEQRNKLRRWTQTILFIEGERWQCSGEPRYVVMTFGLGHNHGLGWGTSLSTATSYNANIPASRYYRIDEYEAAVAAATTVATNRGDTKALPIAQQEPTQYEILRPEALRLRPQRQHGAGDPFLRKCEALIEGSPSANVAGLLLMATCFAS
jgi:hypothetical protein